MSGALSAYTALRDRAIGAAPPDAGLALCHALSDALDAALLAAAPEIAADGVSVALVALGGYGRRELCLFSDVDLMLLHGGRLPAGLVERVFYPLWDAGLKVGHAVRSVAEAVAAAGEDIETLTALLDARLVAGSAGLNQRLSGEVTRLLRRQRASLEAALLAAEEGRRRAEPYQLLETNVKTGRGGLRTLHCLGWVEAADRRLAGEGERKAAPQAAAGADRQTLLASRNALHAAAGKAQDAWLFDLRAPACAWLGVDADDWAVRLYTALRAVDRLARARWPLAEEQAPTAPAAIYPPRRRLLGLGRSATRGAKAVAEPVTVDGEAALGRGRSVLAHAGSLAEGGAAARFAGSVATAIRAAPGPAWNAADRHGLLALLRAGERGRLIFDELDTLGWLERALPEWRHVRAAPQHVPFHEHPLDTHLWRTATTALALAQGAIAEPWCREVAGDLGSLDDLLLAALLHDIGKGWPGDHAETGSAAAAALCRRAGFPTDLLLTVAAAVRQHLLLPNVATRRDIADDRVVQAVADRVGRTRTLRILYLLSVADSLATGPTAWGPWKGSLVRSLFARVLAALEARSGATPLSASGADALGRLLEAAAGRFPAETVKAHVAGMAPGYLQSFSVDEALRHLAAIEPTPAAGEARLDVREDGPAHDLLLLTPDRPGLIALVSGVLALHTLSVLGGRFFTRADGVALQALHVIDALGNPVPPERWPRVERDVRAALAGVLPLEQRLAEKVHAYRRAGHGRSAEVQVLAGESREYTVLEVHAADRVGLLYAITHTLFDLGLDVHLAKIDTLGRDAVDVFYVRDADGRPLSGGERIAQVRAALLRAATA